MKSKSFPQLFTRRCKLSSRQNAIGWIENNEVKFLNYRAYFSIVQSLSMALHQINLCATDKIAIFANTSKEWHFIDMASMNIGAVVIPIYHTYLVQDVEYLIKHSESKVIAVDRDEQLEKIIQIGPSIKDQANTIILMHNCDPKLKQIAMTYFHVYELEDLIHQGSKQVRDGPQVIEDLYQQVTENHIASIIYTSGTTGKPKGAVITHQAFCLMLKNVKEFTQDAFGANDRTLTFLPLSHVFGRCDSLMPLIFGWEMVFARSYDYILEDLEITKPTILMAVPRVFEKIHYNLQEHLRAQGLLKKSLFNWAINSSKEYKSHINQNFVPNYLEAIQYHIAKKCILEKINKKLGGRIRYFISGGSPLSEEILHVMNSIGFTILEGYGLTETTGPIFINPIYCQKVGHVGKALADVSMKLAADGEILIQSKFLFTEYYKDPEATHQVMHDGWFLTGDIGEISTDGFLKITDRKKDIIITSHGKNIAPQKIENIAKTCTFISQLIVIGDKRNYITALVSIEKLRFMQYFQDFGIAADTSIEILSHHPQIYNLVKNEIDKINQNLATYESIRKFTILPIEMSLDNYLTPSLKVKRRVILQDFSHLIDSMYHGEE